MIRASALLLVIILPAGAADDAVTPPPPPDSVIVAAARIYPGVRFHEGLRDPFLVRHAQEAAEYQASIDRQGHHNWERRFHEIRGAILMTPVEVTAETWAHRPDDQIGRQMFESWQASSGHWRVVSTFHRRYGDAVARSTRGIWYSAVIVAD